jgi:hypothetical protein
MNNKFKIALVVVAAVGVGGFAWVTFGGKMPLQSADVQTPAPSADKLSVTSQDKTVTPTEPVKATEGKPVVLGLSNHGASEVQVTIPGLQDTPTPVGAGSDANLNVVAGAAGTYPIMEHGTMPNTRSAEGGTIGYDMEVGKIEVSGN